MSEIAQRINNLRSVMKEKGVDMYVVPTADYHQSEYVGEYFKEREYITGFTGSAGTAVITLEEAGLWTDGRYFIQAEAQLQDTTVTLYKMGEPGVPTIKEYIETHLQEDDTLGFDGRCVAMNLGMEFEDIAERKNACISYDEDLLGEIWENRPAMSEEPAFILDEKYAGESTESKLERIRAFMKDCGAELHILTTLDDICWVLNLRGNDVMYSPLILSYAIIGMDGMDLYVDDNKFDGDIREKLSSDGIVLHPYNEVYEDIRAITEEESVLIDPSHINYAIAKNIPDEIKRVEEANPEILFKSTKNATEIENTRQAELKDSICHVKFMKWIKDNYKNGEITELSASDYLTELRKSMGNYIQPSFSPISAYGPHSACPHYESSPETDVTLKEGNLFLTDTGAGFWEGSTDITRTYAIGEVTKEMKEHFTLVAMCNLRLADAKFRYGSTGMVLDVLARQPLWDRGLDYNHGTGHGVGYLLNVHEGPAGFRWRYVPGQSHVLEEGMIITDEPGIYIEGSHGIRLENETLVRKGECNEYGQFMYLEVLTYIPFDLDAIDPDVMTEEDKKRLNNYHKLVFEKVSPYLNEEETEWLKKYTRAI